MNTSHSGEAIFLPLVAASVNRIYPVPEPTPPGPGAGAGCGATLLPGWLDVDPPVAVGATIAKLAGSSASSSISYGEPPATLAWKR